MRRILLGLVIIAIVLAVAVPALAGNGPVLALARQEPGLYQLYREYPAKVPQLDQYAYRQGFSAPYEQLATVVHELIHVDSYTHQGFYVAGVYYEPYVRREAWPALTNGDIQGLLPAAGPVFNAYVRQNPKNHLGNVMDEINAYTHVLPFVCSNEPASAAKQISNLMAFLIVEEAYLQALRSTPAAYAEFADSQAARGAVLLITQRAYAALDRCGAAGAYPRMERDKLANRKGWE